MSQPAVKFRLHHLLIVMTIAAILLGGVSWFLDSQRRAAHKAMQAAVEAAAHAAELETLLREITTRARLARSCRINSPLRARDNLNGMVSGDTTNLGLYQLPLVVLIGRLEDLNYDFRGVDLARLETLADRTDPDSLLELLQLVDQACPP